MIGVIAYVARIVPRAFDGAYKIEHYTINGTPQPLGPGQYGRDPMLYIEVRNSTVLSLNGKNTVGTYAIDQATQEITWTEDITQPDEVSKGKCQTNGDEMTLRVERGTDDVELLLKRIAKHTG
jgi:hypothetical protein